MKNPENLPDGMTEGTFEIEVTVEYPDGTSAVSYTHLDVYKRQERYTFYYENKIMNLVSQGDIQLLKGLKALLANYSFSSTLSSPILLFCLIQMCIRDSPAGFPDSSL